MKSAPSNRPTPVYTGLATIAILGGGLLLLNRPNPSGDASTGAPTSLSHVLTSNTSELAAGASGPLHDATATEDKALWAVFEEARRGITPLNAEQSARPGNQGVSHFSYHPGEDIATRYLAEGVNLASGRKGDWKMSFRYEGSSQSSSLATHGIRAEYIHGDGVTEWFENRSEGLEHGFTLNHRPAGSTGETITLDVAVSGLTAATCEDPTALEFRDQSGQAVLKYSGLKAWDADGKPITASMVPTSEGIQLAVNDTGARYPLTIDPLITTLEDELEPEIVARGSAGDRFGVSVAIDGNTALIGSDLDTTASGAGTGSAYVFTRSNGTWSQQAVLLASGAAAEDHFGTSVAIEGNIALVGVPQDDLPGPLADAGSVRAFTRTGSTWIEQATITAPDAGADDNYGARVDLSGTTAVIGATSAAANFGAAYIHTQSGSTWPMQQKLVDATGVASGNFGRSVAIDGSTVVVGANRRTGTNNLGFAFIFGNTGGTWTEQAIFNGTVFQGPVGGNVPATFGSTVAVDGNTVVVGGYSEPAGEVTRAGAAFVYTSNAGVWTEQTRLFALDALGLDQFGYSVAISGDSVVVGAPSLTVSQPTDNGGAAYFFTRSNGNWTQTDKYVPVTGQATTLGLGTAVAIDGELALLGRPSENTSAGTGAGGTDVMIRANGHWTRETGLTGGTEGAGTHFGYSVDIEGDTAVVGAPDDFTITGPASGSAYVFSRANAVWTQQAKLVATDAAESDRFGTSVALSGTSVVVGAPGDDLFTTFPAGDPGFEEGSAHVFLRNGSAWNFQEKLIPATSTQRDGFGTSVDIDGDVLVVGAPGRGNFIGAAYAFGRSGGLWSQKAMLGAPSPTAFDYFGSSVSVDASTILVGAPAAGLHPGAAHLYDLVGSQWTYQASLGGPGDIRFGASVALSGNLALVGAPGSETAPNPVPAGGSGAAHFFVRTTDGTWLPQARVTSGDSTTTHRFGQAVGLDGEIAVIGAVERGNDAGAAYVFAQEAGAWMGQSTIEGQLAANSAGAVAISGNTAIVASSLEDGVSAPDSGKVRIYRLTGSLIATPESALLAAFDTDRNGSLSSTEWRSIYSTPPAKEKLFAKADSDASGGVSLAELTAAGSLSSTARVVGGWLTRADVFLEVDADKDGQITRTEIAAMYAPGTAARTIDAFWSRAKGGTGLDLVEWVKAKVLPSFPSYEAAKATRAQRLAVAETLDTDDNGEISRAEFAALFAANTKTKVIDAAWKAATATPKNGTPPAFITLAQFVEAPKLPKLPTL